MPPALPARILLVANGDPPPRPLALSLARRCGAVLTTDGAYAKAVALGLKPRWVVGDMDSLPPDETLARGTVVVFDDDQELSDFEKAVKFLLKSGAREATVLGAGGGRVDHWLINLSVAVKYAAKIRLLFASADHEMELCLGASTFKTRRGQVLSLVPVDNPSWVSLSGVKWPMKREPLFHGSRGLSNVATGPAVRLRVHSGKVWAIRGR